MSRRRHELVLSTAERLTLEQMRDHHPKPYMRVKAAALLRIASGEPAYLVAERGILKPLHRETVYIWLRRYERHGIAALRQPARRKRGSGNFPRTGGRGSANCCGGRRRGSPLILCRPPDGRFAAFGGA